MTSAQVGKTLLMTFLIGYHVDQDPANILMVFPTLDAAEAFSKEKLVPFLRETPCLQSKVSDPKTRDSGNTLLTKSFSTGAHLAIAGANSPTSLASRSRRILLCDEVDKYEASAGTEGDPVNLARKRTRTYWNRKVVLASTPNLSGLSRIEDAYDATDQRRYFVPCTHCGHEQVLTWDRVKYVEGERRVGKDGRDHRTAASAWYECEECEGRWTESDRLEAVRKGAWRASGPPGRKAGFHIWAGYSQFVTLQELAGEWLDAQGKVEQLKDFINGTLGQTWSTPGDTLDWKRLFDRSDKNYRLGQVPDGALFLTAGVDIQKDRIEVQVVGWGRRGQCWLVDYLIIDGETNRSEVWNKLTSVLGSIYENSDGAEFTIRKMAVDCRYERNAAYDWARPHRFGVVALIQGSTSDSGPLIGHATAAEISTGGRRVQAGVKFQELNVSEFKKELYGRLALALPNLQKGEVFPDKFFHFCDTPDTEEYCRQLTAEQLVTRKDKKGYPKREWVKSRRNEALDTWVYARAAAMMIGLDRMDEKNWRALEASLAPKPVAAAPKPARPPERQQEPDWLGGRGNDWF